MNRQEKRKQTILKKYGSFSNMLASRDIRDLILGGYNGGIKRGVKKGFAAWEEDELSRFAKKRTRDAQGRFLPKEADIYSENHEGEANR